MELKEIGMTQLLAMVIISVVHYHHLEFHLTNDPQVWTVLLPVIKHKIKEHSIT